MNNEALSAALYLDGRFNFFGSTIVPANSQTRVQVLIFPLNFHSLLIINFIFSC